MPCSKHSCFQKVVPTASLHPDGTTRPAEVTPCAFRYLREVAPACVRWLPHWPTWTVITSRGIAFDVTRASRLPRDGPADFVLLGCFYTPGVRCRRLWSPPVVVGTTRTARETRESAKKPAKKLQKNNVTALVTAAAHYDRLTAPATNTSPATQPTRRSAPSPLVHAVVASHDGASSIARGARCGTLKRIAGVAGRPAGHHRSARAGDRRGAPQAAARLCGPVARGVGATVGAGWTRARR